MVKRINLYVKTEMENFGFPCFVGSVYRDNTLDFINQRTIKLPQKRYVHARIGNEDEFGNIVNILNMKRMYDDLCEVVKNGARILLSKGPGFMTYWGSWDNGSRFEQVTIFEPFMISQLEYFRRKYEADESMNGYENPFEYQPS